MTPHSEGGGVGVKSVNFLKNLLLYSGAYLRQTKCIVMMTMEGSNKTVKFSPRGRGSFARA